MFVCLAYHTISYKSTALFLNLKIMWGGLPSAVSVEHFTFSLAVMCTLYNGIVCVNMAEP